MRVGNFSTVIHLRTLELISCMCMPVCVRAFVVLQGVLFQLHSAGGFVMGVKFGISRFSLANLVRNHISLVC